MRRIINKSVVTQVPEGSFDDNILTRTLPCSVTDASDVLSCNCENSPAALRKLLMNKSSLWVKSSLDMDAPMSLSRFNVRRSISYRMNEATEPFFAVVSFSCVTVTTAV